VQLRNICRNTPACKTGMCCWSVCVCCVCVVCVCVCVCVCEHVRIYVGLAQTVWPYIRRIFGTPYIRYRIWDFWPYTTVYGLYLQVVHPRLGFNSLQKRCLLFLIQFFFLAAFWTEHSFTFLLTYMHVFALNTLYNVWLWPLFTLENATFWSFWLRAGLAPQPFIFGHETLVHACSALQELQTDPLMN